MLIKCSAYKHFKIQAQKNHVFHPRLSYQKCLFLFFCRGWRHAHWTVTHAILCCSYDVVTQ